ncbi:MAG: GtrA family protein [Candidatus Saccharimonadales bacterium]
MKQIHQIDKPSRATVIQFAYFNLGGLVFFVVGYALFALMYGLLGWHWLISKAIADLVGWVCNYFIQYYLAFGEATKNEGHKEALSKHTAFSMMNIVIDYAIVGGLNLLGVSPFLGLWISSLFFTVWKWVWYKRWVFKPSKTKS